MSLWSRISDRFLRKKIVSKEGKIHFRRWQLIGTRWGSVFVHQIARSDADLDPHDHPFSFISIILKGGYTEKLWTPLGFNAFWLARPSHEFSEAVHYPGSVLYRRTDHFHKITLHDDKPAWTLVFAGPRTHDLWGYLTKQLAWVDHLTYRKLKNQGVTP